MRKGTFSVQKAGSNSAAHNSRKNAPRYLIGLEPDTKNFYELIQSDEEFIAEAQNRYKEVIGQAMQKKQIPNLVQETVLTLHEDQNENDVKQLFQRLHDKYGGHNLLELSIHRDEGHFKRDGIAYYPTKNILKKDDEWFLQNTLSGEFDQKVDIEEFDKVYNYHAHAKFSMFDNFLAKTARMQKKDMSERIKFVSKELGLKFEPGADRHTKKSVHQIKDEHHKKAQEQEKLRLKEQYNFKQYQKQITALTELNSDQKKELHRLNTAVSKGKAEFEELKNKIKADNHDNHVVLTLSTALERVKSKDLTITELKNDLNKLSEAFLERGVTITSQKESLELLESNMSVLRAENERGHEIYQEQQEEIYQLKQSNSSLQSEYSSLKQTSEATEERAEKAESKVVELEAEVKKWTSIFKSKDDELAKANQKIVELSQPKHPKVEEAAIYATAVLEQINKNPNLEFEEVMVDLYSKLSTTIQQEQQQQVKSQSQGITR